MCIYKMLDRNVNGLNILYNILDNKHIKHILDNKNKPLTQAYILKNCFYFYFRPVETIIGAAVGGIVGLIVLCVVIAVVCYFC